jgi:hypothetical protein
MLCVCSVSVLPKSDVFTQVFSWALRQEVLASQQAGLCMTNPRTAVQTGQDGEFWHLEHGFWRQSMSREGEGRRRGGWRHDNRTGRVKPAGNRTFLKHEMTVPK